jgi:hypothetical protein
MTLLLLTTLAYSATGSRSDEALNTSTEWSIVRYGTVNPGDWKQKVIIAGSTICTSVLCHPRMLRKYRRHTMRATWPRAPLPIWPRPQAAQHPKQTPTDGNALSNHAGTLAAVLPAEIQISKCGRCVRGVPSV